MEQPILQAFFSMGVVVLALLVLLYFLKKYAKNKKTKGGELNVQVLSKTSILPKSHLFVIKAEGRTLLIGAGDAGVSLIADLSEAKDTSRQYKTSAEQYKLPTSVNKIAMDRQVQKNDTEASKIKKMPQKPITREELEKSLSFGSFLKSAFKRA